MCICGVNEPENSFFYVVRYTTSELSWWIKSWLVIFVNLRRVSIEHLFLLKMRIVIINYVKTTTRSSYQVLLLLFFHIWRMIRAFKNKNCNFHARNALSADVPFIWMEIEWCHSKLVDFDAESIRILLVICNLINLCTRLKHQLIGRWHDVNEACWILT